MSNLAPTLSLAGITVSYPRRGLEPVTVVDRLSLELRGGTFTCISGRSGSGKTTVLRCLAGMAVPTRGIVTWWDRPLSRMSQDAIRETRRTKIAYMDQASALVDSLSALENVLLPIVPDGRKQVAVGRSRALNLMAALSLAPVQHCLPRTLSGGERQRVALARALVITPEVVVADEPTASLDRQLADVVIGVLRQVADEGGTVVVASHDPAVADAADHVTRLSS